MRKPAGILALGAVLICLAVFSGAAVAADDTVNAGANETTTQDDSIVEWVVFVDSETGETYTFSDGTVDTSSIPDGEYVAVTYTRKNGTLEKQTELVHLSSESQLTTNDLESSSQLVRSLETVDTEYEIGVTTNVSDYDITTQENGTVRVYAGVVNTTTAYHSPVSGYNLTVELELPNGTEETFNVTTNSSGKASFVYDLEGKDTGRFDVRAYPTTSDSNVTVQDGWAWFKVGARAHLGPAVFGDQMAELGRPVNLAVYTTEGTTSVAADANVTINPPNSSSRTVTLTTNASGLATMNFTPQEVGEYRISAESEVQTWEQIEIDVSRYRAQVVVPGWYERFLNETVPFGGTVVGENGSPVTNETIQVSIENESGVTMATQNVTTNAAGQFETTWTTPETIPEDYTDYYVTLETSNGSYIANNGQFEVERRNTGGDDSDGSDTPPAQDIDIRTDTWEYGPGSTIDATVTVEQNGTAVANKSVEVLVRQEWNGPPLEYHTVTTNDSGAATVQLSVPTQEHVPHGQDIVARAVTTVNGTVVTATTSPRVAVADTDIRTNWTTNAGTTETVSVQVSDTNDNPVDGVAAPLIGSRMGLHAGTFFVGSGTTNADGYANYSVDLPADLQNELAYVTKTADRDFHYLTTPDVKQFAVDLHTGPSGDDYYSGAPGEEVTLNYTTSQSNVESAFVTVDTWQDREKKTLLGTRLKPGVNTTVTLPQVTEDTHYRVEVTAVTSSGNISSASGYIRSDLDNVDPITISGTIQEADGTPATNDTIFVHTESGSTYQSITRTNATGAYSIPAWPDREHDVGYYQSKLSNNSTEPVFPRDGSVDMYAITNVSSSSDEVVSTQVPNGSVLDVRVVDENGTPVENASLFYWHTNGPAQTGWLVNTSADGRLNSSDDGTGLEVTGNVTVAVEPPENSTRFADTTITRNVTVTNDTSFNVTLPNNTSETTGVNLTQFNVTEDNGTVAIELGADDALENISVEVSNSSSDAVVAQLNRSNFTAYQSSNGMTYRANLTSLTNGQYNVTLVEAASADGSADGLPLTRSVEVLDPANQSVSLSLVPQPASGAVGSNVTVALVADGIDDGVGAFEANVSMTNDSVATISTVHVAGSPGETDVVYGENNTSVSVAAFGMDTNQTGPVTVAELDVTLEAQGRTNVTLTDTVLSSENASEYNVSTVSGTSVSGTNMSAIGNLSAPPADIDGDGLYMDINGDGNVSVSDVQAMFAHRNSEVLRNNVDKFDYTGNGDVNIVDIQRLFVEATAN